MTKWGFILTALYTVNGIVGVPVMTLLMLMSTNQSIQGQFTIFTLWAAFRWPATGIMAAATMAFLMTTIVGG